MTVSALMRAFLLTLVAVGMASCYLPLYFDAEIELDRKGFYKFTFDGYLTEVSLYNGIKTGEVSAAEKREKTEIIRKDFERDSSTTEFKEIRDATFKVHWEKSGDLFRSKMVTFFRRNENLLSARYVKDSGLIIIEGAAPLSTSNVNRLKQIGLDQVEGEIRVITNAKVIRHNAAQVKDTKDFRKIYTWRIRSVSEPTPKLVISIY